MKQFLSVVESDSEDTGSSSSGSAVGEDEKVEQLEGYMLDTRW